MVWTGTTITIAVLSTAGVAIRAMGYPSEVPQWLMLPLTRLIEPGVTIWWLALGATLQGFPASFAGYAVAILGNTLFWLSIAWLIARAARFVKRRLAR